MMLAKAPAGTTKSLGKILGSHHRGSGGPGGKGSRALGGNSNGSNPTHSHPHHHHHHHHHHLHPHIGHHQSNKLLPPTFEECVRRRDYVGALAILEFTRKVERVDGRTTLERLLWQAYCAFHGGDYEQALEIYQSILREEYLSDDVGGGGGGGEEDAGAGSSSSNNNNPAPAPPSSLSSSSSAAPAPATETTPELPLAPPPPPPPPSSSSSPPSQQQQQEDQPRQKQQQDTQNHNHNHNTPPPEIHLYLSCCYYYLQLYDDAEKAAQQGPIEPTGLRNRLLFHIAHKTGDETRLLLYHQKLTESTEDQLSLAAIHYLRSHFQEATEIYKRLLLEHRDDLALNVYVAMCYYKMDYYDVSLEVLAVYLQAHPGSWVALNLKACNTFRLYNGKAAAAELKTLLETYGANLQQNEFLKHNLVVFNGGEGALRTLPPLIDVIPEARLNLVIYYLRHEEGICVEEAFELMKDLEPSTPQEYVLKGVVNACLGQALGSREHLKMAQQLFQLVGASASECDTIPGRQCMASCFYLLKNFEDVNTYLSSIKTYMYNDDDFNWNYGISLAATGDYKAAEEALLSVRNERYKAEQAYLAWLCRCCIMNGNPHFAWELYCQVEAAHGAAPAFALLQLVANDCYRMGHFLFAAKAFHILERLDPGDPEYWEGKRGACAGVFQLVLAGKLPKEDLQEAMVLLQESTNAHAHTQASYMLGVMKKYEERER